MWTVVKRSTIVISVGLATVLVTAVMIFYATRRPPDMREFWGIMADYQHSNSTYWHLIQSARPQAEKDKARSENRDTIEKVAERCLRTAETYPGTTGELAALYWAACSAPKTKAGQKANEILGVRVATADLGRVTEAIKYAQVLNSGARGIAPVLLERVRQSPSHADAAQLLAWVCSMTKGEEDDEPTAQFTESADLIVARYANSPDIANFCECLGGTAGSRNWAGRYESQLRTILETNKDRRVRCAALMALASIVQSAGEDRQLEAENLYKQFVKEFDGEYKYYNQQIEKEYHRMALLQLEELKSRGIAKPAPEITGVDLDGRPMKLSETRGKVVLLSFWATWCFPCMKMITYERELLDRFKGKPFTIVGVNSDLDEGAVKRSVATQKMDWRSFRDKMGDKPAISRDWKVVGYPTLYLIDQEGIVRKRWIGMPPREELDRSIKLLVDGTSENVLMEQKVPADVALAAEPHRIPTNDRRGAGKDGERVTGFIDKVHHGPDGNETKYAVFIPHNYDGMTSVPAILFLHGAGHSGDDGHDQLTGALAQAICNNENTFAFIAVFPQSHFGSWQADSPDGERALGILDEVTRDYQVDKKRVYLTGPSMGGEGTWSLAAAHPNRWAAIVPICSGGDAKTATKLKDIPCWCFHGDADRMISVELSREMVTAIKNSGGRPLYHEYPGVGHSCWDLTYANPDLYEWLLRQEQQ